MRKLFGTDGVRGVANLEPMTSEIAMQLGRTAAHIFMRRAGRHPASRRLARAARPAGRARPR